MKHLLFALLATATAVAAPNDLPSPLDLNAAIRYALDHNYSILQARQQVQIQEGMVTQVVGQALPNLGANGSYGRNDATVSETFPQSTDTWIAQVKLTQLVFAGGGVHAAIESARLNRAAARADLQAAIDTALLDVRTKFYNVILTREQVQVQEDNIRLYQRELSDTRNQFQAGSVSNFEVLRARVSLANAQPDLITARNNYRLAVEQLRQSLGAPAPLSGVSGMPDIVGSLDYVPVSFDLDQALESARARRPELVSLHKHTAAGEAVVRQAASTYYPNVQLFGTYEWEGEGGYVISPSSYAQFGFPVLSSVRGWLYGVQGSWSIFDGGQTRGKVHQAKAQLEQERLSEATEDLSIDVEVRQAYSNFQQARELVDASQQTVAQAAEALRLANERFHVGSATQLDVLTSQVALTQAKTNQVQANYNYLVAVAALRKAMGLSDVSVGS
ncbi:MAG TPA: TolC family protein [Opitutaceae bacterium]|jgi:outer membrane protein TolC|nr:TolC family protein [Opitutaceae bacterium]